MKLNRFKEESPPPSPPSHHQQQQSLIVGGHNGLTNALNNGPVSAAGAFQPSPSSVAALAAAFNGTTGGVASYPNTQLDFNGVQNIAQIFNQSNMLFGVARQNLQQQQQATTAANSIIGNNVSPTPSARQQQPPKIIHQVSV